ncbi:MAG: hypothetical protein WD825_09730 [Gemmatimonadaceae bacterium]
MRGIAGSSNVVAIALLGLAAAGCDLFTADKKSIAISADTPEVTVGQGTTANVVITVTRNNFDQPVTLVVEGPLPTGLTATFTLNPVPNGTATTTLRVTASGLANPSPSTLTIRATGDGVTEQTLNLDLTVNVTGSYELSLLNSSLTVAQGGGGSATVLLTRSNLNVSSISLDVSGAPAGVTTTFSQSPTTDRGGGLTITASSAVATGTYPLFITSTTPGIANRNATLSLVVIAAPNTTPVSLPFCSTDMPAWFAFQNEGFAWQRVTATDNTFNFSATSKVAVAYTFVDGGDTQMNVFLATRNELSGITDRDCDGTKTLAGTVAGLTSGQSAYVVMGANGTTTSSTNYTLQGVAERPLDLVATRGAISGTLVPDKMIVLRSLALSSTIPVLDFTAAESFAPVSTTLSVTGFNTGDAIDFVNNFVSATSTFGTVHAAQAAGGSSILFSVPAEQQVSGDTHELFIDAYQPSGPTGTSKVAYFQTPTDRTEALGPVLSNPAVSVVITTPYARLRGQLASQADYPSAARFVFFQGTESVKVVLLVGTADYFGAAPGTWDLVIPDFTGTTGFSSTWMLTAGQTTPFHATAYASRGDLLFGALPVPGESIKFAYWVSSASALLRERRAPGMGARRAPLITQYLRR